MKLLLIALVLIFIPIDIVGAAPADFITCEGTTCSACDIVGILNKAIIWLFGAVFLLFTYLMVIAGFGLITSNGNTSALEAAKSKFTNAIIGLIIMMSAWLIVDTLMRTIVGGGSGEGVSNAPIGELEGWGPWSTVKCQKQTPTVTPEVGDGDGVVVGDGQCKILPLNPITDELALRMENGETVIWENTNPRLRTCVNKFIGLVGGTVTSAYRPPAYQKHLYEVSTKACALKNDVSEECSAVKAEAEADRAKHGLPLCGAVAQNSSTHSSGNGVDISGISHGSESVQEAAENSCLIWKNHNNDPYHYDLKPNCTCN